VSNISQCGGIISDIYYTFIANSGSHIFFKVSHHLAKLWMGKNSAATLDSPLSRLFLYYVKYYVTKISTHSTW